jgi:hypothetical protein
MTSLTTLHLSGNGLTGSLPNVVSHKLMDLSLSHNIITGPIPLSFQNRRWSGLDLSYNRINGKLSTNFASNNIDNYSNSNHHDLVDDSNDASLHSDDGIRSIPAIIHNNFIVGRELKQARFQRYKLWKVTRRRGKNHHPSLV